MVGIVRLKTATKFVNYIPYHWPPNKLAEN